MLQQTPPLSHSPIAPTKCWPTIMGRRVNTRRGRGFHTSKLRLTSSSYALRGVLGLSLLLSATSSKKHPMANSAHTTINSDSAFSMLRIIAPSPQILRMRVRRCTVREERLLEVDHLQRVRM